MTYNQLIKEYGTPQGIAKAGNMKIWRVYKWKRRGIPVEVQLIFQRKTKKSKNPLTAKRNPQNELRAT